MTALLNRIHARIGDLWWYSAMLFLACRVGDLINAFIGLWLVPKYVPQQELGAVLPLLQVTSALGLPIAIVVTTFTKFLSKYKSDGNEGKVKSLIQAFWLLTILAILCGTGLSVWIMPHFFERIRVESGSLGILILATAILSATTPVFTSGLQALKKFHSITLMNLLTAPVRLITMLIAMPFRALSGYMLGQCLPMALQIVWAGVAMRKEIHPRVRATPFWKDDWKAILRYTLFIAAWQGAGTIANVLQTMVIRQRLPEIESAAYYIISRFAELGTYAGVSIIVVLFPLVSESATRKADSSRIFWRAYAATGIFGIGCTALLAFAGDTILSLSSTWTPFVAYHREMTVLSGALTLGSLINVFVITELAAGRFGFLYYAIPMTIIQGAFFVCFAGYGYFEGLLPPSCVKFMANMKIDTLRNLLWAYLCFHLAGVIANMLHLSFRARHNGNARLTVQD